MVPVSGASVFLEPQGREHEGARTRAVCGGAAITGVVPAFFWMAVQWHQRSLASEQIASEGDDQNGRIVAKLVAIGHRMATLRALEPQIFRW